MILKTGKEYALKQVYAYKSHLQRKYRKFPFIIFIIIIVIIIKLSLVENCSFIFIYSTTASSSPTSVNGAELTYADLEAGGVLFPFQFSKSKSLDMADRMYTMPFYLYSQVIEVRFIILFKQKKKVLSIVIDN